jgi:hypothetical protein
MKIILRRLAKLLPLSIRQKIVGFIRRFSSAGWSATPLPIVRIRPADVSRVNRDIVIEVLDTHSVSYSYLGTSGGLVTQIAVLSEYKPEALAALRSISGSHWKARIKSVNEYRSVDVSDLPLRPKHLRNLNSLQIYGCYEDHSTQGTLRYGRELACDVQFWEQDLSRPEIRLNPQENSLPCSIHADLLLGEPLLMDGQSVSIAPSFFNYLRLSDIDFPVDAVYLWVDGEETHWRETFNQYSKEPLANHYGGALDERFRQIEELRYSLRSLDMFAPWIRKVYVVTAGQRPSFLVSDDRLVFIDHSAIAHDARCLPTFNSDAISSWISRIDGLSEHFLYINDDMFFGRSVRPELFFTAAGQVRTFSTGRTRPAGPISRDDSLADAKAKNLFNLVEQHFGRRPREIVRHTPYPMSKEMMQIVERELEEALEITRRNRFRQPNDVPIEQAVHYISQILGLGVASSISYGYANITTQDGLAEFAKIVQRRNKDVFCLNDAPEEGSTVPPVDLIRRQLEILFPVPSRWEIVAEDPQMPSLLLSHKLD